MLAVDFLELLRRVFGVLLLVEKIEAFVVELVGRLVGQHLSLLKG